MLDLASLLPVLVNTGGMGIVAGVLLYLHANNLKTFKEELRAEREQCRDDNAKLTEAVQRNHDALMGITPASFCRALPWAQTSNNNKS